MTERTFQYRSEFVEELKYRKKLPLPNAPRPLVIYLWIRIRAKDGLPPVPVSVRLDTASDYTTLPWSKLEEAGFILDSDSVKKQTVNRGLPGEYKTELYPCTFEIHFKNVAIAAIDTLVARKVVATSDAEPVQRKPDSTTVWSKLCSIFSRTEKNKTSNADHEDQQMKEHIRRSINEWEKGRTSEEHGVLSLADLMRVCDVHILNTDTGHEVAVEIVKKKGDAC